MARGARLKIYAAVAAGAVVLGVGAVYGYERVMSMLDGDTSTRAWEDTRVLAVDSDGTLLVAFHSTPAIDYDYVVGEVPGVALLDTSGVVTEVLAPQDDPSDCWISASGALKDGKIAVAFESGGGSSAECHNYGIWLGTDSGLTEVGEVTRGVDTLEVMWGSLWFVDGGLEAIVRATTAAFMDDSLLGVIDPATGAFTTWHSGSYLGFFPDACGEYGVDFSIGALDDSGALQPHSIAVGGGQLNRVETPTLPLGYENLIPVTSCGGDVAGVSRGAPVAMVWQNDGETQTAPMPSAAGDVYLGPEVVAARAIREASTDGTLLIWDRTTGEQLVSVTTCSRLLFHDEWIVLGTREGGRCVPSATTLEALMSAQTE